MVGYLICGVLAAMGCFCLCWLFLGWRLPGMRGGAVICLCYPGLREMPVVRRYCWLRDMGMLNWPLILVDCGLTASEREKLARYGCICTMDELEERLKLEREKID